MIVPDPPGGFHVTIPTRRAFICPFCHRHVGNKAGLTGHVRDWHVPGWGMETLEEPGESAP
jgi:hypothetical protein